jgi:hypothetical protein
VEYVDIPAEHHGSMDEASVDDRMGWAPLGRACVTPVAFIREEQYLNLPAFTMRA